VERFLDIRYQGQSYELMIPFSERFIPDFHDIHQKTYGYSKPGAAVEIVNLRVRAIGATEMPPLQASPFVDGDAELALLERREVVFEECRQPVPFYRAESLRPGNWFSGPAVVVRTDTTVLVGARDTARVDGFGNLLIEIGSEKNGI
jgi:N-methylhydantoinase A